MILNHRVFEAAAAVQREAIRRDIGKPRDPRFDIAISMLLDLADDLSPDDTPPVDVDVLVEELHAGRPVERDDQRAMLAGCTNDSACESALHLSTCPRRNR